MKYNYRRAAVTQFVTGLVLWVTKDVLSGLKLMQLDWAGTMGTTKQVLNHCHL